jgi:hypothetical protein
MGDLANFSITRNGSVTTSIPKFDISCDVINSQTGAFIRNLSGTFPNSLQNYTNEQIETAFMEMILKLILIKAV